MRFLYGNPIPNPCVKDCPNRGAGCAINCKAWNEYRMERDKLYQERRATCEAQTRTKEALKRTNDAIYRSKTKNRR